MPLKILQHKSYHVYNAENIARVKRDEAAARGEQAELDRRATAAETEARVARLRKEARKKQGQEAERALDRQLQGLPDKKTSEQDEETNNSIIIRPEKEVSLVGSSGHINFWSAEEAGRVPMTRSLPKEKTVEQEKAEALTRMFLAKKGDDVRGWYASEDLKSAAERALSMEQSLDRAYKDGESKRLTDPLTLMNEYLAVREDAKHGRKRFKPAPRGRERYPMPVSHTKDEDELEPVVSRLLSKKPRQTQSAGPISNPAQRDREDFKEPSAVPSVRAEAASRETSERSRAQELLARKKREREMASASDWEGSSVASTPRSTNTTGWGMYNAEDTRAAAAQRRRRDWADIRRERDDRQGRRW